MSIFNLKKSAAKKKVDDSDKGIPARLNEDHGGEKDTITEKQLETEGYYALEPDVTTEKQLDDVREGESHALPEKRLDDSKSKLYKHRNPSAYEGDINKLEEKRLAGKPTEDEKYKPASSTPKKMRWWEAKSPDGLKIASNKKQTKEAQAEYFENNPERWKDEFWGDEATDPVAPSAPSMPKPIEEPVPEEIDDAALTGVMKIEAVKSGLDPLPHVYLRLSYDPSFYEGAEDYAKETALETALDAYPELRGLVNIDEVKVQDGTAHLRLLGDNLIPAITKMQEEGDVESGDGNYKFKLDVNVSNQTGTPTAMGTLTFDSPSDDIDVDKLLEEAVAYVEATRPELVLDVDSFDLDKVLEGVLPFMAQVEEDVSGASPVVKTEPDFDIEETPVVPITAQAARGLKKKTITR